MRQMIPSYGLGLLQAQLERVLEGVGDGVILTGDGKAVPNGAARRILGLADDVELDPSDLAATIGAGADEGRFRRRATSQDGRELLLDGSVASLGEDRAVIVFRDATREEEQGLLTAQLVSSGKLTAVGELAGVAHEINNPLFAILGLTEFLLMETEPDTKAHERLELIHQTGLEIKEIVRALLDFARENADERHLVVFADVIRSTVDLVRRTNAHKGVQLLDTYDGDESQVAGSPNQLTQLFLNLIANARQAMPNGGTVSVDVRRDRDHVVATVSDDGPGIDPGLMDRIFEPFFTTKRDTGGTGLGLSVSLAIAESHGGRLTAVSQHGRGATFTLRLPVVEQVNV